MGQFTFVTNSYQKLEPKYPVFKILFHVVNFCLGPEKLISGQEDKKIKEKIRSTFVLEIFCQSSFR
jgi:hypothetical protein